MGVDIVKPIPDSSPVFAGGDVVVSHGVALILVDTAVVSVATLVVGLSAAWLWHSSPRTLWRGAQLAFLGMLGLRFAENWINVLGRLSADILITAVASAPAIYLCMLPAIAVSRRVRPTLG